MKRALIHPERCANCQACLVQSQCPMKAILREQPEDRPWVDFYRCSGCLRCKNFCRHGAIEEIVHSCTGNARSGW